MPLALQAQGITRTHLPFAVHYLIAYGPAVAALTIARLRGEPLSGAPQSTQHPLSSRLPWWSIGFGSPLVMFAVAQLPLAQPVRMRHRGMHWVV